MTVAITSPVLGLAVGATYTGPLEPWLLAEGYARNSATVDGAVGAPRAYADTFAVDPNNDNKVDYTGDITADGHNTLDAGGKADGVLEADDPTVAANREDPWFKAQSLGTSWSIANDAANLNDEEFPNADFDFDQGGVDTEAPTIDSITPNSGPAAGGTVVTITGANLTGVTGVTFGGTPGTSLELVNDAELSVVAPAHAAGAVNVVVTDPVGSDTEVGGFTYTA